MCQFVIITAPTEKKKMHQLQNKTQIYCEFECIMGYVIIIIIIIGKLALFVWFKGKGRPISP